MKKVIFIAALMLVSLLLALLGYSYLPLPLHTKVMDLTLIPIGYSDEELPTDLPAFLYDQKMILTLNVPAQVWLGDQYVITLAIKPVETKSAVGNSNSIISSYHANIEARLDLEGGIVTPGKTILEPIHAGQSVQYQWQVRADGKRDINGKLWIYLNILQYTSTSSWRLPRFALPLQIAVKDIIGLPVGVFRMLVIFTILVVTIVVGLYFYLGRKIAATS